MAFAGTWSSCFLDVAVAVLLYALFKPVNGTLSMLRRPFRLSMAAIRGATLVTHLVALHLLGGADSSAGLLGRAASTPRPCSASKPSMPVFTST